MFRTAARVLLLLSLAGTAATAHSAQECGFLPTSEVDAAFPDSAPWHTMVGGAVGHCTFLSDASAPVNSVSFVQQFKSSAADAGALYDGMRQGLAGKYAMTDVDGLGDRAFRYEPEDGTEGPRITSIVAQKGKLVVTISLALQRSVKEADVRAAATLGRSALRGADDPAIASKASSCPWLNEAGLSKLFGGKPHEVQVYGENSCMAADKQSRALLVSAMKTADGFSLEAMRTPDCQYRDLPELGDEAKLSFACKSGNPRAGVGFVANGLAIELTWTAAGAEPGEAEKVALVELAKAARAAEAAR